SIAHGQIRIILAEREYFILSALKFQYAQTFDGVYYKLTLLFRSHAFQFVHVPAVEQLRQEFASRSVVQLSESNRGIPLNVLTRVVYCDLHITNRSVILQR